MPPNKKGAIMGFEFERNWLVSYSEEAGVTEVTIPDSVNAIDLGAFYGCKSLTSVTIPDSVIEICSAAFGNCTNLTSVTIPDSVTRIGYGAFEGCTSLGTINVSKSYTTLTRFHVEDTKWYKENSDDFVILGAGLLNYRGKDPIVTIPDNVTTIGESAFRGCTSLTSVTITDSVTEIGSYAFSGCTSLTSVTIPDSVTEIGYAAFEGCTSLKVIKLTQNDPDIIRDYGSIDGELHKQLSVALEMLKNGDCSAKVKTVLKYPFIILKYLRDRDEPTAAFIKKSLGKMMKDSIAYGDAAFISALCETDDFFTKKNIDKFIGYAIEAEQYEIQIMLTKYKGEHFGSDDSKKRFKL